MKHFFYLGLIAALGLFISCDEQKKDAPSDNNSKQPLTPDWNLAYALAGEWQTMTDVKGVDFTNVEISIEHLDSLLLNPLSEGFRVYLGYDTLTSKYKGIAVSTIPDSLGQKDLVGGDYPFYILEPSAVAQANILVNPVDTLPCDIPALDENEIEWECATGWAYNWKNSTTIIGDSVKGFFIHKRVYEEFGLGAEDNTDWGIKIYFGIHDGGNYKTVDVSVNSRRKDKAPKTVADISSTSYKAYDFAIPCPSECGPPNDLNNGK